MATRKISAYTRNQLRLAGIRGAQKRGWKLSAKSESFLRVKKRVARIYSEKVARPKRMMKYLVTVDYDKEGKEMQFELYFVAEEGREDEVREKVIEFYGQEFPQGNEKVFDMTELGVEEFHGGERVGATLGKTEKRFMRDFVGKWRKHMRGF